MKKKQTILNVSLALLILGFTAVLIQAAPGNQTSPSSPLPPRGRFDSPLPPPSPCPPSTKWTALTIEITVEGLRDKEVAELQLLPNTSSTAACLAERESTLPRLNLRNKSYKIKVESIPDGAYKLEVNAPSNYFREPQGYLFRVSEGQIVHNSQLPFQFKLIPPSDQDLPPCRNFVTQPSSSSSGLSAEDVPFEPKVVCRAERMISISIPPKRPEPRENGAGILHEGYHYVGPKTTQDNQGVWGRNYVVDPGVDHSSGVEEFVVERVYANDSSYANWMEAGWAEHSFEDDEQYIYEYDSVTKTWNFFSQYTLSSGSAVETIVQYKSDVNAWRALYYLGGDLWALLAQESLGFTTASNGFNRGEIYTDDDTHPILPVSGFDKGYLFVNGAWRIWDTDYPTEVDDDDPYEFDMINEFHQFNIHSPVIFIPLVMKNS